MNDTPLLLLPGLYGTGELFPPLIEHLSPDIRPVVVSYPSDRALGYSDLLPLVLDAVDSVGPCVVLGESFSGPLAVMAATARPDKVRALVLCVTFLRNPLLIRSPLLRHLVFAWPFRLTPSWFRNRTLLGRHATPALRALARRAMSSLPPRRIAGRVREVLSVDVRSELRACRVPVLYLQGADDRVIRPRNAADVLAACPQARVVTVDAPHLLLQTRPAEAAKAVSDFFERSGIVTAS